MEESTDGLDLQSMILIRPRVGEDPKASNVKSIHLVFCLNDSLILQSNETELKMIKKSPVSIRLTHSIQKN